MREREREQKTSQLCNLKINFHPQQNAMEMSAFEVFSNENFYTMKNK